jgi:formylglycine-generating enzyme required for sulfatase activity/serine/threonine protein phosphatase PrpC
MDLTFHAAGAQIMGERDYQEDVFLIAPLGPERAPTGHLIIVADGMGGHAAGHVASRLAVDTFHQYIASHYPSDNQTQLLRDGLDKANAAIAEAVRESPTQQGMGCTFVAALFEKSEVRWISVGDSHLYLVRGHEITKKNADHSYGGLMDRLAAEGQPIDEDSAHPRNMLLSAMNGGTIPAIDAPESPLLLRHGDRVILGTDGLNTLDRETILAVSLESTSAKSCVDDLLRRVIAAQVSNQDNTTVVAIDAQDKSLASMPAPRKTSPKTPSAPKPEKAASTPLTFKARDTSSSKRWRFLSVALAFSILATGVIMLIRGKPAETIHPAAPEASLPAESSHSPGTETVQTYEEPSHPRARQAAPLHFRDRLRAGGRGPRMLWIEGGTFQMGSSRTSAEYDEQPAHTVRVSRFAISQYEITHEDYAPFAKATSRPLPERDSSKKNAYPAVMVNWEDAVEYARWLSKQTGHTYRLPSEAEWEYAAAAGTNTPFWWGFEIGKDNASCYGCGTSRLSREPKPVGSFKPNPFGLHDTAGNVLEWVQDCYHGTYADAPNDGRPWEDENCDARVARGGSFGTAASSLRTTKRNKLDPVQRYDDVGIRVVRASLPPDYETTKAAPTPEGKP